jgi:hypothetical protein
MLCNTTVCHKLPPAKSTQKELFGSFIEYCWYLGWRTVGIGNGGGLQGGITEIHDLEH